MALATFCSQPEITLKAENSIASQRAPLFTNLPTIIRWWSISALVELVDSVMIV